jgi:hypothetical protein
VRSTPWTQLALRQYFYLRLTHDTANSAAFDTSDLIQLAQLVQIARPAIAWNMVVRIATASR